MPAEISFDTNGEDFKDYGLSEVFRILEEVKAGLLKGENQGVIEDAEGVSIGRWSIDFN